MASRIEYIGDQGDTRQRQPRREDGAKLIFVRLLSCVICGRKPVEAAHLRVASRLYGKRGVGNSERPDDVWVAPLCAGHHRGNGGQHTMNELEFWRSHNIANPFALCLAIHAAYEADDLARAEQVVAEHRILAMIG